MPYRTWGLPGGAIERKRHKLLWRFIYADMAVLDLLFIGLPFFITKGWLVFAGMLAAISPDFAWGYRMIQEKNTGLETKGNLLT